MSGSHRSECGPSSGGLYKFSTGSLLHMRQDCPRLVRGILCLWPVWFRQCWDDSIAKTLSWRTSSASP
eukprot:CAMPEP_0115430178 /NCGR_PEP_ID=MMETSP0271-20121206/30912_1 /TAXON_ID=71861 /ORGANISM="Scrippsiella trochoidea, Strain CCMP3099" /LENGTH=67 /DNA_ID=CAMNT_0002855401 /DNA_START=68 /DNA_END=267 /DNA_ORIENTATION=+